MSAFGDKADIPGLHAEFPLMSLFPPPHALLTETTYKGCEPHSFSAANVGRSLLPLVQLRQHECPNVEPAAYVEDTGLPYGADRDKRDLATDGLVPPWYEDNR